MGALARFLLALERLARRSGFKIEDAYKFAKQEFGEITPLLRKQIQNVYKKIQKPVVGKPGKKEGVIIPMVKEGAKKAEGIETLDVPTEQKPSDTDLTRLGIENLKNPRRSGGPLDPVTGITRTIARRILDKKGIKIDRREDPLDIFLNNFGIGAGTDIQNLGEEIAEAESTGRKLKPLDDLIEIEGFFNLQPTENPEMGMTDEELLQKLEKDLKEKETLEDFDPTDREPNAKGGLTRTSYAMGKGPVLPEDPTKPVNPFGPKPTGPVLPDKSMMASAPDLMDSRNDMLEILADRFYKKKLQDLTDDEYEKLLEILPDFDAKIKKAPSIKLAEGGLAGIINL
tara:strand:+ start:334 stop:1359 length:1026 start_codon:yes stop_codon:yes gene_type:complete